MDLSTIEPSWLYVAGAAVAGYLFASYGQRPAASKIVQQAKPEGLRLPDGMTERLLSKAIGGNSSPVAGSENSYEMMTSVPLKVTITPQQKKDA